MTSVAKVRRWIGPTLCLMLLAGCSSSHFDPPEVSGRPAMIDDGGKPRLWVLTKQEENRQVSVGSSRRSSVSTRSDTFFHFDLQAFDPETARPLWKQRLLTIGDDEAQGTRPSRVIGSSTTGALMGQDGDVVWLMLDAEPWAVSAADGKPLANGAGLEERNPELKGVLPSDTKFYGFDQGLVLMTADARHFVIRGPDLKAVPYSPPPPATVPLTVMANGRERMVPMRPVMGEVAARLVQLNGNRIGLYSAAEAADAAIDPYGDRLFFPYSILNQGAQARRTFWNANTVPAQSFDEKFDRFTDFTPIEGTPAFLNGRFLKVEGTDDARVFDQPTGVLVWHSTRIDSEGVLALSRLDDKLQVLWTTELPISETNFSPTVSQWQLPGRVVLMGARETVDDGVTSWETHLVTVQLSDGASQAWSLQRAAALP